MRCGVVDLLFVSLDSKQTKNGMNRLVIKNFGAIKEASVELKPLLLLIGGQGTGKSTIAKVLSICRDVTWYLKILDGEEVFAPFRQFGIKEYFQKDSYIEYREASIVITYTKAQGFSISSEDEDVRDLKQLVVQLIGNGSGALLNELGVSGKNLSDGVMQQYIDLLRVNTRTSLYIPAERNLIGTLSSALASILVAKVPLPDTLIEYMGLFEKAKKEFPSYEIPFLNLSFVKKDEKEAIVVAKVDDEDKELPLQACSSGIQSVLPLLMVVDYALKLKCFDSFVLEEPEQNLFPTNQMELLRFLIRKMGQEGGHFIRQLTISTHSPYLLSVLNISMLAAVIAGNEDYRMEVNGILPEELHIKPEKVGAYMLGGDEGEIYCKNVIDEKTGTIGQNYLDTVSDTLGAEFGRLYNLYIKSLRKNGNQ